MTTPTPHPSGMARRLEETLQMRLSPELKATLDMLRKAEPDLPSRSEMVRRLIERAAAVIQGPPDKHATGE